MWRLLVLVNVARGSFLSRNAKRCVGLAASKEICRVGTTNVLVDAKNSRKLRFGDECATETTVKCKGDLKASAGTCDEHCNPCPCEVDTSGKMSASYMNVMYSQLASVCSADTDSRVLMIGLGGGEMPNYLAHHCSNMHVEAVELNGDVIQIAKQYFGLNAIIGSGRLSVEQADGLTGVQERARDSPGAYDAVLVDCFSGGGEVPESCRSHEFLQKAGELLKPGGRLLQNMWSWSSTVQAVPKQYKETVKLYRQVFDAAESLEVPMPAELRFVHVIKGVKEGAKTNSSRTGDTHSRTPPSPPRWVYQKPNSPGSSWTGAKRVASVLARGQAALTSRENVLNKFLSS